MYVIVANGPPPWLLLTEEEFDRPRADITKVGQTYRVFVDIENGKIYDGNEHAKRIHGEDDALGS